MKKIMFLITVLFFISCEKKGCPEGYFEFEKIQGGTDCLKMPKIPDTPNFSNTLNENLLQTQFTTLSLKKKQVFVKENKK